MSTFREKAIEELARLEREAAELRAYLELTAGPPRRIETVPEAEYAHPAPAPALVDSPELNRIARALAELEAARGALPPRIAEPTVLSPELLAQLARRGAIPLTDEERAEEEKQRRLDRLLNGGVVRPSGSLVTDPTTGSVTRVP